MKSILPSCGRFTVRASDYLKQDSDVMLGGGTDETELLQAILDKALEWGGLHLIVDGAVLVRGLTLHSNTTVECTDQSCGFFLKDGAAKPLVSNAKLSYSHIHTENIRLLGGTYNLNSPGQERMENDPPVIEGDTDKPFNWLMGVKFIGVRNLTMRDMRLVNQRTFAGLFANWEHVVVENFAIDLPDNRFAQNQDGLHFWGPGRDLCIRNIRGGSGDDFMALAPDEHDLKSDITDVVIDGVYLEDADQGIRMLSRGPGRLDRVFIRNVYGTYKSCGFFINPWFGKGYGDSKGNYGAITVENVNLQQTYDKYGDFCDAFLFRIGGRIQSLTLKNIQTVDPNDARPLVDVSHVYGSRILSGNFTHVSNLTIDGLEVVNHRGTKKKNAYIKVDTRVDNLVVRNVTVDRSGNENDDTLIRLTEEAQVDALTVRGVLTRGIGKTLEGKANHTLIEGELKL